MQCLTHWPQVKDRSGIACGACEKAECNIIISLVPIEHPVPDPNFSASRENSKIERRQSFRHRKLTDEVPQRRHTATVVTPVQVITTKAQEDLRLAARLPSLDEDFLHQALPALR